jgi:hypothetical protein
MFQRSKGEREIILGGCRDRAGPKENYEFGKSYDGVGSVNETVGKGLRDYLSWQFPKVFSTTRGEKVQKREESSWQVDMEWTGIMGFREGGIPIVSWLSFRRSCCDDCERLLTVFSFLGRTCLH